MVLKPASINITISLPKINSRYMMLIDALNVVLVKEIAPQWLFFSKNVRDVGVYGMLEPDLKILRVITAVDKN